MDLDPASLASAASTAAGLTPRVVIQSFLGPAAITITLRGVLALEACGNPLLTGGDCTGLDIAIAAAILRDPCAALAAHQRGTLPDLAIQQITPEHTISDTIQAIHAATAHAFAPVQSTGDSTPSESFHPPGVGWWLHLLETLTATYGWPLDQALDTPLAQAFCLLAALAERNGSPLPGPSFIEREILSQLTTPRPHSPHPSHPSHHENTPQPPSPPHKTSTPTAESTALK